MASFSAVELLSRHSIEYKQTRSGKYTTSCPQCNGEGYLSVKIDSKGVQWHCQSCDEGDGEYFEQYDERSKPIVDYSNPKAVYDYVDESGARLFQALRFETDMGLKVFRQRTGPDQKPWSIKGVRIVPYRLPELVEDISRGSAVFVVEGEKDVDTLRRRGVPATCNPMGAKKWWPEFNRIMAGADIVVCGDNDEPGREHVALVARNLRPVVKRLRVLDLASVWPEIEESQDISDWFAAGLERERLGEIVDGLPDWTPAPEPKAANGHDNGPPVLWDSVPAAPDDPDAEPPLPPLKVINPALWAGRAAPARQWLVENWIPTGVVTGLYGDGGIGKTLLLQQLQASAACGLPWLGLHVEECISLGIYCEDSEDELHRRMESIVSAYGCDYTHLAAMPMLARMGEDNLLMVFDSKGRGELTKFYAQVRELALDLGAKMVGVDTASDTFGGNEIDRGNVRQFVQRALGSLALAIGGSVMLLAHPSVAGMASGEGTSGSTGWSNALRSRLYLKMPEEKDGEAPDPAARVLARKKANYAPRSDTINIRWDKGVLSLNEADLIKFRHPCEDVYLALLTSSTASGNTPSPKFNSPTYAPTMFSKMPKLTREGYHKGDFERAQTDLLNKKIIVLEEVGRAGRRHHIIVKTECEGDVL